MPATDSSHIPDALAAILNPDRVFGPDDDEYRDATSPDNSSYTQRPAAVVRPRSAQDVAAAVTFARGSGLRVVVQATGHGAAEPVTGNDVLVDTSSLQSVTVDGVARTARVGAGAQWSQVQAEAEKHGLLGLSGTSPTVGVVGYLVNGGVGWLVRPFGLASATLRAGTFVDGQGGVHSTADADADPDVLWALRGGAPVGIVTEAELDLVPVTELWAGYLLWPGEHREELAAQWLARLAHVPSGLTSTIAVLQLPPEGPFPDELLGTVVVHVSYASIDGEAGLASLREALREVAEPTLDTTGPADAATLAQIHLDPSSAVPALGTGAWLGPVDAEALEAIFGAAGIGADGGLNMIEVRHVASADVAGATVDGALTSVPGPFLLHAVGAAGDDDGRRAVGARLDAVDAASARVGLGVTAPGFREGQPDTGSAHPADVLDRLRAVRRRHDPDGVLAFQRAVGGAASG